MTTPNTARQALERLLQDFPENPEIQAKVSGYPQDLPLPAPHAYLVEYETLVNGSLEPKRYVVLDEPAAIYRECTSALYKEAGVASESLNALVRAAREVMSWTEASHRPPVRDELECGRMAGVRLHALAELREALLAFSDHPKHNPISMAVPELSSFELPKPAFDPNTDEGRALYEATRVFERMGYMGMDRVRETLSRMGARAGDAPGTVVIDLEMPEFSKDALVQVDKEGA